MSYKWRIIDSSTVVLSDDGCSFSEILSEMGENVTSGMCRSIKILKVEIPKTFPENNFSSNKKFLSIRVIHTSNESKNSNNVKIMPSVFDNNKEDREIIISLLNSRKEEWVDKTAEDDLLDFFRALNLKNFH